MQKAPTQVSLRRRSAGFTLLELMVTLTVMAIMLGIGVPSFQDMMRRNRLATQTNALISALALARSEAVKRGVRVTVCPANVNQDACSDSGDWAENGMIIFTDGLGLVGTVDLDEDEPNNNDAILQRLPAAAAQRINIDNPLILISYMQNGNLDLPPGDDTRFTLVPEDCSGAQGARQVQLIAAGRASARSVACP